MNKRFFYFIITIFLVVIFYFQDIIINKTLFIFNHTKESIQEYKTKFLLQITSHFNQSKKIELLTKENQEYKNYINNITPFLINCKKLKNFSHIQNPNIIFAQTISYANLPDITSIYINYNDNNLSIPKGLIFNGQAAGIVIKSFDNFSMAYLNNNPNTSYTVFVGKNKIPGILFGGSKIFIKYIPKYHKLKKGDLVITSGLDKIFYEGIKVGKVSKIIQKTLYQEVEITPFYNSLHPSFFYVVK